MNAHYRQGDVLLVAVDTVPEPAEPVARSGGRLILAEGEATGHAHAVTSPDARLLRGRTSGRRFLCLVTGAVLGHEEHAPVALPPGIYEVRRQREYVAPTPLRRRALYRYVAD